MAERADGETEGVPDLGAWYDLLNPWGPDNDFYLGLVMAAGSVLDVGCGTGTLLHRAREAGHTGRLVGLDPSGPMLARARRRTDLGITWVSGDAQSLSTHGLGGFDLVVMTGHAFQCLTTDDALRDALTAIRGVLRDGGRFAFETRNPLVRPWERWTPDRAAEVTHPDGRTVRVAHEVDLPVEGELVRFSETFTGPDPAGPRVSRAALRFLGTQALAGFLAGAGLVTEARYGDWERGPLSPASPEIITVARRDPGSDRPGA
ncbi:class I SAM-dependent DNA methyltransferase [Streptomyces sp. YGL11-2]|uniref:class I SAM-dependent DNA methyltransferase n=1 Tax=Streptomyces sp. YGL11-2 TaxID=3414028 RepID=UPI003CF260C2